jgi:hypothetical protein
MVEYTKRGTYVVFQVPGNKDIRMRLKLYLALANEASNVRQLQSLILKTSHITSWTPTKKTKSRAAAISSKGGS